MPQQPAAADATRPRAHAPPQRPVPYEMLDLADRIQKLAALRDAGILTEDEFTAVRPARLKPSHRRAPCCQPPAPWLRGVAVPMAGEGEGDRDLAEGDRYLPERCDDGGRE